MKEILTLIERTSPLFSSHIKAYDDLFSSKISAARFLVLGGTRSSGLAVTIEIFKRCYKSYTFSKQLLVASTAFAL